MIASTSSSPATSPPDRFLVIAITVSTLILLGASTARHLLFQSTALDLVFFDQAVYLISQGLPPIVTLQDVHILGDHAALIFYPLALFYKIYPSVYWLLLIQAIALSVGAWPTYQLAQEAQLNRDQCRLMATVYLLYPLVFNINLFDFHPEVMALPAVLGAVLAARQGKFGWFSLCLALILSCKAVLSLTVIFLGLWLWQCEKKRWPGLLALSSGVAWFLWTTQGIIPYFRGGAEAGAVGRYNFLGDSVLEIAQNLFLKPQIVLSYLLTLPNLSYLLLLLGPLLWGLSWRHLSPLIPAIPSLLLNLLTDYGPQKDLIHQYSLMIFPFLLLAVIESLAHGHSLLSRPRWILLWAVVGFLSLAKFGYFGSIYLTSLDTWSASRTAIAAIQTEGGVLTSSNLAPHLSHRPLIKLASYDSANLELTQFDYILLNQRHPGWESSPAFVQQLIRAIQETGHFQTQFQQDGVILFTQPTTPLAQALDSISP